jgi:pantoate--beta-alanine ligase
MLTVVLKLFEIVRPDVAVFGQKDFQQAALVRAMVKDLDVPVEIVVAPIVRDDDGLALSSRNAYLSPDERVRAVALPGALTAIREAFARGERDATALARRGTEVLRAAGVVEVDYLAIVDPASLEPLAEAATGAVVLLAARVGTTRLLDNAVLGTP